MRKTKLSQEEIAELDATKAREARNAGLKLLPVRDRGWAKLSNGLSVHWNTKYANPVLVPDGDFGIMVNGKVYRFDAEELRKYLRWA